MIKRDTTEIKIDDVITETVQVEIQETKVNKVEVLDKQSLYKEIVSVVSHNLAESYIENEIDMASDTLESEFGVRSDMYVSFYGQHSTLKSSSDVFIIVESTDKYIDEVNSLMRDYSIKLRNNSSERDKLKFSQSKIGRYGNYIVLSVLGAKSINEYTSAVEAENEYRSINSKAVKIALEMLKSKQDNTISNNDIK